MRNIFDQYQQPENRLTHALVATLDQDRSLMLPFLRRLGISGIPQPKALLLTEQQVPGLPEPDVEIIDGKGLPDAAIYTEDGFAVLFESKIQSCVRLGQIERHRRTAQRHGFPSPWLVVVSVDKLECKLLERTIAVTWQDVYSWFNRRTNRFWAQHLVDYMRVFERKMLLEEYGIRGTITMFDGLRFDEDNPYTYREGKRLIRLLGDLLQKRNDLKAIGVDPTGERRSAITGKGMDGVWDFIPLVAARDANQFTDFPHLTMGIHRTGARAAVTVPNGVKGGFKSKLISVGQDGFVELVHTLERRLRPVLRQSPGAKPMIYITQRHFLSQRSAAETDARLDADLRTACRNRSSSIRYQPEWIGAIYQLLAKKRSNIQFGVEVDFRYTCPRVRSPEAAELFAGTWKALSPLLDFVLKE